MNVPFLIIMVVLPMFADINVKRTFEKYSFQSVSSGHTAEQVARMILDSKGLQSTEIEHISGNLTDHYDPTANVVRLSDSVYGKSNLSAIGIASHECGHAFQYAESYKPIVIRSKIVPVTNICSKLWCWIFLLGLFIFDTFPALVYIGIGMFTAVLFFQTVTLPTEFNASRRAVEILRNELILDSEEIPAVKKVLTATAMTYVTSLLSSIIHRSTA